jgi:hypothetical protein
MFESGTTVGAISNVLMGSPPSGGMMASCHRGWSTLVLYQQAIVPSLGDMVG